MGNFFKYKDTVAFHPGYYIKELVDDCGLTQDEYAKRLGTTPKNLSLLIRGEQSLSLDIAIKLSRLTDTSIEYWLNLQKKYDTVLGLLLSEEEIKEEQNVLKVLGYSYFKKHFGLPELLYKTIEQVQTLRQFLAVSSLTVLKNRDLAVRFRQTSSVSESSIIKANAMVQIATKYAMKELKERFSKDRFEEAVKYALTLTSQHKDFYRLIKNAFSNAGVVLEVLPNLPGSKTNGATKRIGDGILLMVNDRNTNSDTFWFSLFHEIGHIHNGDYGVSFDHESGEDEDAADRYAEDCLIPHDLYVRFVENGNFSEAAVLSFARSINRDPGIVVGRLQNDEYVEYTNKRLNVYKRKYEVYVTK